jgi:hypothetical protein
MRRARSRPSRKPGKVVGVQAGQGVGRGRREGGLRVAREGELADPHAADAVLGQGLVDHGRDGPQVLTHQHGPVAVGLEAEDRVQLLGRVAHIGAVGRLRPVGDPVQAVEGHDVVDPEHAGGLELGPEDRPQIGVAALPRALRVGWREAPVLAPDEEVVGGRAHRRAAGEEAAVAPQVVGARVDPQGQVEVETGTRLPGAGGDAPHLGVGQELDDEVVAPHLVVEVLGGHEGPRVARRQALRPRLPGLAQPRPHRPERGVGFHLRAAAQERFQLRPPGIAAGRLAEELAGQGREHRALGPHDLAVLDLGRGGEGLAGLAELRRGQELAGSLGAGLGPRLR